MPRTIEVTSYAEVVLAPQGHDLSHPAFSNLFVQTELVPDRQAILCTRRPRSADEHPPWMMHLMTVRGTTLATASFETDRMKFIGRGRSLASPAAMDRRTRLSDSQGPVLDPVVCIRQVIRLEPNETVPSRPGHRRGRTREAVAAIMDKYHDPQPGRPRLRAGLDAQPDSAPATQRHRGRRPGLRPTGRVGDLCLGACAGRRPAC